MRNGNPGRDRLAKYYPLTCTTDFKTTRSQMQNMAKLHLKQLVYGGTSLQVLLFTVVATPKHAEHRLERTSEIDIPVATQALKWYPTSKPGGHRPYMSATPVTKPHLEARLRNNTHPQEDKSHGCNTISVSQIWRI